MGFFSSRKAEPTPLSPAEAAKSTKVIRSRFYGKLSNSGSNTAQGGTNAVASSSTNPAAADALTMTLAQRLNDLATANADGLLDDDEYRLLRQSIFERFAAAGSSETPTEVPVVPISRGPQRRPAPASRPTSIVRPPSQRAPSIDSQRSIATAVSSLFRRVRHSPSIASPTPSISGSIFSVQQHTQDTSSLYSRPSFSRPSVSRPSISRQPSDDSILSTSRAHSQAPPYASSISSRATKPPSSFHLRISTTSTTEIPSRPSTSSLIATSPPPLPRTHPEDFDESNPKSAADLRAEIESVEAEGRKLLDAFNGLELTVLTKTHRGYVRPPISPPATMERGSASPYKHTDSLLGSAYNLVPIPEMHNMGVTRVLTPQRNEALTLQLQRSGTYGSISDRSGTLGSISDRSVTFGSQSGTLSSQRSVTLGSQSSRTTATLASQSSRAGLQPLVSQPVVLKRKPSMVTSIADSFRSRKSSASDLRKASASDIRFQSSTSDLHSKVSASDLQSTSEMHLQSVDSGLKPPLSLHNSRSSPSLPSSSSILGSNPNLSNHNLNPSTSRPSSNVTLVPGGDVISIGRGDSESDLPDPTSSPNPHAASAVNSASKSPSKFHISSSHFNPSSRSPSEIITSSVSPARRPALPILSVKKRGSIMRKAFGGGGNGEKAEAGALERAQAIAGKGERSPAGAKATAARSKSPSVGVRQVNGSGTSDSTNSRTPDMSIQRPPGISNPRAQDNLNSRSHGKPHIRTQDLPSHSIPNTDSTHATSPTDVRARMHTQDPSLHAIENELADIRRRKADVSERYERRLEFLRAKLRAVEIRERLAKR